jgi:hypothetical protein
VLAQITAKAREHTDVLRRIQSFQYSTLEFENGRAAIQMFSPASPVDPGFTVDDSFFSPDPRDLRHCEPRVLRQAKIKLGCHFSVFCEKRNIAERKRVVEMYWSSFVLNFCLISSLPPNSWFAPAPLHSRDPSTGRAIDAARDGDRWERNSTDTGYASGW